MSSIDEDEHVRLRDRVMALSTVMLAERFSEIAARLCRVAENELLEAREARARAVRLLNEAGDRAAISLAHTAIGSAELAVVDRTAAAASALSFLMRANDTLEGAIRLHASGRA